MKDTPAGVGGSEGITAPPGYCPGVRSITGKPPWVGIEGMDIGVPCCITTAAELGGEEPPGGKKTWAMAPEGIQGLALAIQSPVCWLPEALNIQAHKNMPRCSLEFLHNPQSFKLSQWSQRCVHTDTWTHAHTLSRVPGSSVSCVHPLPEEEILIRWAVSFPPSSHFFLALEGWLLLLSRHDMHGQCVWGSHIKQTQWAGEKLPSCTTFSPLSPLVSKVVL